jgi:hypothetical protein
MMCRGSRYREDWGFRCATLGLGLSVVCELRSEVGRRLLFLVSGFWKQFVNNDWVEPQLLDARFNLAAFLPLVAIGVQPPEVRHSSIHVHQGVKPEYFSQLSAAVELFQLNQLGCFFFSSGEDVKVPPSILLIVH